MTEFERTGDPIQAETEIAADAETCYRAFAEPEGIARWFVDRAEGGKEVGETITWYFDDFGYALPYEVVAADVGRLYSVGFRAPGMPDGLLEIEFEAAEGGRTKVRLVNYGFHRKDTWDEEYEGVVSGWAMALATLAHQLEHFPGQDRESVLLARSATLGDLRDVLPLYRTGEGLASWLTTEGELGELGSSFEIALRDGTEISGTVLARTALETLVSWDGEDAVIGFKAFRMGPAGYRVALHVAGWGWDDARRERARGLFEPAIDRLVEALGVKS